MKRARQVASASFVLLAAGQLATAATYVLPVVVRGAQGAAGSYWDSEVRIIRLDMQHPLTVRRAWVALKGGGFTDDPSTAPTWTLPPPNPEGYDYRMLLLTGSDLMAGVPDSHAAIGLEIDGPAKVILHNANTEGQQPIPPLPGGGWTCCLPGNGHMTVAATQLLSGSSFIPWATSSGTESPFRTNVGFINPGVTPLHLHVRVFPLFPHQTLVPPIETSYWVEESGYGGTLLPELDFDLPALGWLQVNDIFANLQTCSWVNGCWPLTIPDASLIQIDPQGTDGYLAYATPVYTPKNDPEFIWAEPGDVSPPAPQP
jgi:hypothetical protein